MLSRISLVLLLLAATSVGAEPDESLLLATTTSVRDSGLLDELLPGFSERTGIQVRVVAVGSGAALRMGAEGNADALLTHAPAGEKELLESGAVESRTPFMQNYFVIAGPEQDPADVRGVGSPAEAYRRLAAAPAAYVSRADDSGTHRRETALLEEAGLDPELGWPGFARTGSGMGLTLQVAGEKRAYVLSDLGTFLAFRERVDLSPLSADSPSLRNVYSILRVSSERFPRTRAEAARKLEDYLVESSTQERLASFGRERFGRSLFTPLRLDVSAEKR